MNNSRREFMRQIGIALGSTLAIRCGGCYAPVSLPTPTPVSAADDPVWGVVQSCWLGLRDQELQLPDTHHLSGELQETHSEALAELVSRGDLDANVAKDIEVAFEEALEHVQRQSASCYIALPPEFVPRGDLMSQLAALEEMAAESEIDPATVARVREALEQDIAWLTKFAVGEIPGSTDTVDIPWTSMEAARILIELLLSS